MCFGRDNGSDCSIVEDACVLYKEAVDSLDVVERLNNIKVLDSFEGDGGAIDHEIARLRSNAIKLLCVAVVTQLCGGVAEMQNILLDGGCNPVELKKIIDSILECSFGANNS